MTEKELEVRLSLSGKHKKMFDELLQEEREKTIEECKEVVRQHWINGTVAHRIAQEIYNSLEQLKGKAI